jgi:hypothetical protein
MLIPYYQMTIASEKISLLVKNQEVKVGICSFSAPDD